MDLDPGTWTGGRYRVLLRNVERLVDGDGSAFDALSQRFSGNEFHDEELPSAGFLDAVNCGDVGMI